MHEPLQRGQSLEAEGRLAEAIAAYDEAIATSRTDARSHGLAWMNRGNALQKLAATEADETKARTSLREAVSAYDLAIECFKALPAEPPAHRNHLGAAWLNRGHAQLAGHEAEAAAGSFVRALDCLRTLPLEADPHFRLNLAGAHANLAQALLGSAPDRAAAAAREALAVLAGVERAHPAFGAMSLRARRALVLALGESLRLGQGSAAASLGEATDAIDDGLALAREAVRQGHPELQALAVRLFRLGAQLYATHQPHFLAEFLLENLDPAQGGAFADDEAFHATAHEMLERLRRELARPRVLRLGDTESERLVRLSREVSATAQRLAQLRSIPSVPSLSP